jgi:Zn-dependent protease with chaperone function
MPAGWIRRSILCAALASAHLTPASEPPADFDRRISAELARQSPEAAALFQQANEARTKGDSRTAAALYERVRSMVPGFVHATRRQCGEEFRLGLRGKAVALCREAVGLEESAPNLATLAHVLTSATDQSQPSPADVQEALTLAARAVKLDPDDPFTSLIVCEAAVHARNLDWLRYGTHRLTLSAPDEAGTHYFLSILAANEQRFGDARRELAKAHALGLPDDAHADLLKSLNRAEPLRSRLLVPAEWIGGMWLGGLILLLMLGWLLSQAALRATRTIPTEADGRSRGTDRLLREIYRGVLWLCCGYYYLSIPVIIILVLLTGGGLVYAFISVGRVPLQLLLIVAGLVVTTLGAVMKSIFVRPSKDDPGLRLDLARNPGLVSVLGETAARIGTRPVDSVYMTPGTEVAVMERGGMLRQLVGRPERCLILGTAVLEGMRLRPFQAILAHEYGHLSNRDTAGGGFALSVRRSVMTMATRLAQGGAARWYNPAWLFVIGFNRVFLRISQGASRLQEVLADRWAATLTGAEAFERGLRHVIERTVRFDDHVRTVLDEVIRNHTPLGNLYHHDPCIVMSEPDVSRKVEEAIHRPPSPYDSHPSPADRFAWVHRLPARASNAPADDGPDVWSLIDGRDAIELEMTKRVRSDVMVRYRVEIHA